MKNADSVLAIGWIARTRAAILILAWASAPPAFAAQRFFAKMRIAALAGAKLQPWDGASRGTVLVLPGADLSRLPFAYPRKRVLDFRAGVPDDPAFAGVSAADLYFRNANELPSPAFDVRREGDSAFVFLGLAPDGSVKGLWNDEKLMRVWTTVLDNLGVRLSPETPYLPGLDLYDGDAFHNW